jgi:hypothetical protein
MVLLCLSIIPTTMKAQSYESLWKQVEQAEEKNLPQTVAKLTDQIFRKGERERNSPQMLKAYVRNMDSHKRIAPDDSLYVDLNGLERWASEASKPMDKAILHSLMAEIYADYAKNNRWGLRRRKPIIGETPPADIREWTAKTFVDTVKAHARQALSERTLLLQTSSKTYAPFVAQGEASKYYHHDMYHLLASRSVDALKQIENLDEQDIDSESSVQLLIEEIYQQMISTYQHAGLKEGYLLTSLNYLNWKWRESGRVPRPVRATGGRIGLSQNPYIAALNKLRQEFAGEELCAEVEIELASYAYDEWEYPSALQISEEAIKRYPHYPRVAALRNIRETILAPILSLRTPETAYPGEEIKIEVSHDNLTGFKFQLYPKDGAKKGTLAREQYYKLQPPADYRETDTTFTFRVPDVGAYSVRVVPDTPTNGEKNEKELIVTRFKVLNSALPDNKCQVVTLDARSGHPIPGATVTLYNENKRSLDRFTTDANGKVVFPWKEQYDYVKATKGEDLAMSRERIYNGRYGVYNSDSEEEEQVTIITDRTIYRPGQTVYVKVIVAKQLPDTANAVPNKAYTVLLTDANNQEIGRKRISTNKFGSFTTDFALPAVCMNGNFGILVGEENMHNFRVEDYKRPTFEVAFEDSLPGYKLGDNVQVKGHAKAYSGVPLADTKVAYTVKRTKYRWWWTSIESQSLVADTVMTDIDGAFTIPVLLKATEEEMNEKFVFYRYTVEAVVTNAAGETQSNTKSLTAGNRSLVIEPEIADKIRKDKPVETRIDVRNLNGDKVATDVTCSLYRVIDTETGATEASPAITETIASNSKQKLSWTSLSSGTYLLKASARDAEGRETEGEKHVVLFSIDDNRPPVPSPVWYYAENTEFDNAHPAVFCFGTSERDAYILMNVCAKDRVLENKTFFLSDSVVRFSYPYKETYGDGLTLNFCFVKNGEVRQQEVKLQKRIPEKELTLKWNVFRDKLHPRQKEEWRLTILTPQGKPADAEMLALMYDASLDEIWDNDQVWNYGLHYSRLLPNFRWQSNRVGWEYFSALWDRKTVVVPQLVYDRFLLEWKEPDLLNEMVVVGYAVQKKRSLTGSVSEMIQGAVAGVASSRSSADFMMADTDHSEESSSTLPHSNVRSNFSETAFFYPQLRTDKRGEISLAFTMPESLTRWNFQGYAHTKGMLMGTIDEEVTTSKEFMLSSNLPRFVRVGDRTSVSASLTNLTGEERSGTVTLTLFDPMTEKVVSTQRKPFAVEAGKTVGTSFTFTADDKYELLGCRMVADGGSFSDGEQNVLPVLSDKRRMVEAIPLPIRGKRKREFDLAKLFNSHSPTATGRKLTVEFTGNPAWYAVQALPAISMPSNDNAISWAAAYYANTLAAHIVESQPRLKTVIESWKRKPDGGGKEAFMSDLEKNQEVKNILLNESPWVLDAQTERQQMERVATLLDTNTATANVVSAANKLNELQNADGSWSWYKGMSGSRYVTTYVVTLAARLSALTDGKPDQMTLMGYAYLQAKAMEEYKAIRKEDRESATLSDPALRYLYLAAITGQKPSAAYAEAHAYFLSKVPALLTSGDMGAMARAAIVLQKAGKTAEANDFVASLKEHLTGNDEQGMSFAFNENPYIWNGRQLQAQVDVMEALAMAGGNDEVVEEMKLWLLKRKQTQRWDSPVSTADATYALLMRGTDLLASQGDARITIGGETLSTTASSSLPGLAYVKRSFERKDVTDARGLSVEKRDEGIAWGAVYAEYLTPIADVERQGGALNVKKSLYVERLVEGKPQLHPVDGNTTLRVGDKVVARLTIQPDRAMDFVQLKDDRAACFEPIDALSGYRWGAGTGYYVDIKDASTNFFFDHLSKGVYVLEYAYRVAREGTYQPGLAVMQCAYSPEYAAHSEAGEKIVIER